MISDIQRWNAWAGHIMSDFVSEYLLHWAYPFCLLLLMCFSHPRNITSTTQHPLQFLLPDWPGMLAVIFNFTLYFPITVVCPAFVRELCCCWSAQNYLNSTPPPVTLHTQWSIPAATQSCTCMRCWVFSAARGPWRGSVSDGYGSVGFCRTALSTTGICQACSAEPTHSVALLLLLLAIYLILCAGTRVCVFEKDRKKTCLFVNIRHC